MDQSEDTARIIGSRNSAVTALCLTGIVAAQTFWDAIHHAEHKSYWLLDLNGPLPAFAAAALNMAFYAYLLWLGVVFCRGTKGKERVLVAGWFGALFLGWTQNVVSTSAAAVIGWVKAAFMLMAVVAAVDILRRTFANDGPGSDGQSSRNT